MSLLLLRQHRPQTPATPISLDNPTNTVTIPWSRRPYLAVDKTDWLPLGQVLAQNGVDARRVYEIADANGIQDPRRVPLGMTLSIPR